MPLTLSASEILNRYFLDTRSRVLDVAAALDRIQRASGAEAVKNDARLAKLQEAIRVLTDGRPDRAERVQQVFSLTYDPKWRGAG